MSSRDRELFAYAEFPETFAGFLRHRRHLWATRRTDRFTPLDINLAEHHLTIQGSIGPELVNNFLALYGEDLLIPEKPEVRDGEILSLYIPAASFPKRQLLRFSVRDAKDAALPILSRSEGAPIAAREILALLILSKNIEMEELDDVSRQRALKTLIATVVFQDPHRLAERLQRWESRRDPLRPDAGLEAAEDESDLQRWIEQEAEEFLPRSGDDILQAVTPTLERLQELDRAWAWIPVSARPDGLRYFPTVGALLLHGVQDLLKNVLQFADPWKPEEPDGGDAVAAHGGAAEARGEPDESGQRAILARRSEALAKEVKRVLAELPILETLLTAQQHDGATSEFFRSLDRWTAYVVTTIRLKVPFIVKFDQTLPLLRNPEDWEQFSWLKKKRRLFSTHHEYPLALRDALAVHAELVMNDLEIRYDQTEVVEVQGTQRIPVSDVFGNELRASSRLIHRYSSKRPDPTSESDAGTAARRHLYLRVPIRLVKSIRYGYAAASAAFLATAGYVLGTVVWAFVNDTDIERIEAPVIAGSLAVTLSLWLTAVQHPRPVVYRKLWLARRCFYLSLLITIGALTAYALRVAFL